MTFYPLSDILNYFYKKKPYKLTKTLFRTCVNAGDQLWIISRHDHGGYAAPSYGNRYDLPICG